MTPLRKKLLQSASRFFSSHNFNPERALAEQKQTVPGGVTPDIQRSSTFTSTNLSNIFSGQWTPEGGHFVYSRHFNPTVMKLGKRLAKMEGTEAAHCTASGISAIVCTLLQLCKKGDHIVASNAIYGGTHAALSNIFSQFGIETTFVDPVKLEAFAKAIRPNTKVLYTEVVSNPLLKVTDIENLSKLARAHNLKSVVDNTFTPMLISPAKLGVDIVVHSLTKFVGGGSDLIAGAICGSGEFINSLLDLSHGLAMLFGPTMDPSVAYTLFQRLPTLPIRMREHSKRAIAIANLLEQLAIPVYYPGLPSHPQHQLFSSMLNEGYGFGGILSLDCGTAEKANELICCLQKKFGGWNNAVSLGFYDTLASPSSTTTSSEIPAEEQAKAGLSPGLLRMSVGFTGLLEDRLEELTTALKECNIIKGVEPRMRR